YGYAVATQSDGKIIVAGYSVNEQTFAGGFALVRYNADGSLDKTFGTGGKGITDLGRADRASGVGLQSDGKIVAAGRAYTTTYKFALARYNTDGSLDSNFGTGGTVLTDFGGGNGATSVALQSDGKIVAAGDGYSGGNNFALARYNADGSLD